MSGIHSKVTFSRVSQQATARVSFCWNCAYGFGLDVIHVIHVNHIIGDIATFEDWSGSVQICNSQGLDMPRQASPNKQSESLGG